MNWIRAILQCLATDQLQLSRQRLPVSLTIAGFVSAIPMSYAQVTTANLRGSILDAAGQPLTGVTIVLESGEARKEVLTNEGGQFAFSGLKIGGPYKLTASKQGFSNVGREGLQLRAGANDTIQLSMSSVEVMQVVGTQVGNSSQKATFYATEIRNLPSVSQDPKDIVRLSPDAVVDGDSLSIGGANNRFNSITIDGIRQDDDFGLNANGYPSQRSPISLQAIQEISVERSPFDVRYSNFLGGNVNVVTKSGTNDFEGSVMTTYTDDGLTGNKTKDRTNTRKFEESRLGLALGGPVVTDKLHFFLNLEGLKASVPYSVGFAGSGQTTEVKDITPEEVARVEEISKRVYGYDPGTIGRSLDEQDLKFLGKLDWTISERHRLEAKYQRSKGNNINAGPGNVDNISFTSNWFDKTETLDTMSLGLFSDWDDRLSTRFELSGKQVESRQIPLEDANFMQAEVESAAEGSIFLGPDPFRHANEMDNRTLQLTAEANYLQDEHLITGGVDIERVDIYNIFVPFSKGSVIYDTVDAFEARTPKRFEYRNAITHNPKDAAADWNYGVTSVYLQDEWQMTPSLTARYGLRSEIYAADDSIARNDKFVDRYGFENTKTLEGKQVHLPRLGLSYKAAEGLNFRGGVGLYSGGTPNVWISNTYSNDGVRISRVTTTAAQDFDGRNIPETIKSQLVAGSGNVDALDPDFKIPQSWKFGTGFDYRFSVPSFGDNYILNFDYTYTKTRYGLLWKDLRRNYSGIANNQATTVGPDGRAIYDTTPTNATSAPDNFDVNRGYDLLLTNTDQGYGHTASLSLNKRVGKTLSLSGAYAWQKVEEVNPGTSSQSTSNYGQVAIGLDPNKPDLARSNYERTHRFLVTANYEESFFDNLLSTVSLLFERRSGQPYSYTFGGQANTVGALFGEEREFARRNRMLFYVPKGDGSDVTLSGIDEAAFNDFLKKNGLEEYRGRIAPRNAFTSDWVNQIDMRLAQELPGFSDTNRTRLVLDIENLPNFLNKKWGQVKQVGFPYLVRVADVNYDAATNKYVYSNLNTNDIQEIRTAESVWKMQVALYYDF
jgi:hypothetical protein